MPLASRRNRCNVSLASVRNRTRKHHHPPRRLEVAKTRQIGACAGCCKRRARRFHAPKSSPTLPTSVPKESSTQLHNVFDSNLTGGVTGHDSSGVEVQANIEDPAYGLTASDPQPWDDLFVSLSEVENKPSLDGQSASTYEYTTQTIPPNTMSTTSETQPQLHDIDFLGLSAFDHSSGGHHQQQQDSVLGFQGTTEDSQHMSLNPALANQADVYSEANRSWMTDDQSYHSWPLHPTMNSNQAVDPLLFDPLLFDPDTSLEFAADNNMHSAMNSDGNPASTMSTVDQSSSASYQPPSSTHENSEYSGWEFSDWVW